MIFNIYFGTIGTNSKVTCKYRFSKNCRTEEDALAIAEEEARSLYLANEGKYGIPSYSQIYKEHTITGIPIEDLYEDHIYDMTRFYAIPVELDSIPKRKLSKW